MRVRVESCSYRVADAAACLRAEMAGPMHSFKVSHDVERGPIGVSLNQQHN